MRECETKDLAAALEAAEKSRDEHLEKAANYEMDLHGTALALERAQAACAILSRIVRDELINVCGCTLDRQDGSECTKCVEFRAAVDEASIPRFVERAKR